MRTYYRKNKATAATAVSATRPTLAADGVDVTTWMESAALPESAYISLTGSASVSIAAPTGGAAGAEIWGYIDDGGGLGWTLLGYLNRSGAIAVNTTIRYGEEVGKIGLAERLSIAGTVTGGTATFRAVPIEVE